MKGQISIETIMILALVIMILIPVMLFLYITSSGSFASVNSMEVNAALSQLSTSSSIISTSSETSTIFAKIYIPSSISLIESKQMCKGKDECITEFIANMRDNTQYVQVAQGKARLKSNLTQGTYYLKIESVIENGEKITLISIYG